MSCTIKKVSDKKKIIQIFNIQILKFIKQSLEQIPDLNKNAKIINLKNSLETTVSLTPKIPIQLFYSHIVLPFYKEIENNNDEFFLNYDTSQIKNNDTIILLKTIYKNSSNDQKKIMWKYVQKLKVLCLRYFSQNKKF